MSDERIFISYSTKDGSAYAATLRRELESLGFSVWQDLIALEGGRDWWSQIENALRSKALQHFILVVTPGALASSVVRREIRLARQEGKTINPVLGPGLTDLNSLPRWLGQVYDLGIPEKEELLTQVLRGPSDQKRVPMMAPEPPADFVQRSHEFGALKAKLLDAKGDIALRRDGKGDAVAITAALRGAGGYGKTTLAKALAHDPDIVDAYFDGILWAELGEKSENLLSVISDLMTRLTGTPPGLGTVNAAASALGEALGDRRILLVIDDAWREQDLRPFLEGGRNTTRLITTRCDDILPAKAERKEVDAMAANEALSLLSWDLPKDQSAEQTQALAALAQRLGEWALLLKLANGFLRNRVIKNHEPLPQAIAGANKRLTLKGLTAFDARNAGERANAIAKTIGVSLDLLDENERARFAELAVFPEDVDVPLGVVSQLWGETGKLHEIDAEDLLQRLQNLSLLLFLDLDRRTFRFHDTVRHFLQEQAGKEALTALHKMLLQAMDGIEAGVDDASRRYYYLYRPAHLAVAGERGALDALLLDPGWLQAKLDAVANTHLLISEYEQWGRGAVQDLIHRTLRVTSGICARDKRQLLPQLYGRLMSQNGAAPFCAAARQLLQRPALLTTRPSLPPPGAEMARLEGHGGAVRALAVLPDGRLASAYSDMIIRLWEVKTGEEAARLEDVGHVEALAVLPDGRLASGSYDSIRLWDVKTAKEAARLKGHGGAVRALAALPDGRLASGSEDKTIRLWDLNTAKEAARLEGHGGAVRALAALPDGRLASGSDIIRLWDVKTAKEARLEGRSGAVRALAALPDGLLASGSWDSTIRLWEVKTGEEAGRLEGHGGSVTVLAALPGGRLASGSEDKTIRLWDVNTAKESARLEGHGGAVRALAALPDGRLASGSEDKTIRLWDVNTAKESARLEGHGGGVSALAVLPDGRLASASSDVTIRLWDLKTAKAAKLWDVDVIIKEAAADFEVHFGVIMALHGCEVRALAALPDGRLASGSEDSTIRLWDVKTGEEAARLEGHGGSVTVLAALPDGRLASGSWDSTIRLWDVKTGAEITRLEVDTRVLCLTALPGGGLVAGDASGLLHWLEILD